MSRPIGEIISWWENYLTGEERRRLMGGYVWTGSIEQRHQKLREMYERVVKTK